MLSAQIVVTPRRFSVPLRGTVTAGTSLVIVSKQLNFLFRLVRVYLCFEVNTNRTVTAEYFISEDAGTDPTNGQLGKSIFASFSHTLTLVGDEEAIAFDHIIDHKAPSGFLKVLLTNSDAFDHEVDSILTVEELTQAK